MKAFLRRGSTSKLARIFVQDSSQTDGRGLTGLTNASASLTCYYIKEGQNAATAVSLSGGTLGTWSSGGFIEVSSANLPGVYELGLPDAALSTGNSTLVMLKGATNMAPVLLEIELTDLDPMDAVRAGLTALPNAAAGANGGLPLGNASGRVDVGNWLGSAPDALSSGKIPADLKLWLATAPLALSSQQVQVLVAAYASGQAPLQPTVAGRTLDVAATGEAGLDFDNIHDASGAHTLTNITVPAVSGAVGSVTGNVGGNVTGSVGSVVGAVGSVTADVGVTQAAADKAWSTATRALTDKAGFALSSAGVQAIWDALTSALTTAGSIGKRLVDFVTTLVYAAGGDATLANQTTLLGRLTSGRAANLDNLDAAVSSRSSHAAADIWAVGTRTLTSFGTLVADIWAAATRTLTAIVDSSGVTTLLGRLTSGRATNLDNLDAAVSTRSTLGGTAQTGDAFARLGAPAGASLAADVGTRLAASAYSAAPSAAAIDTQLSGTHGSGAWGGGSSGAGTGANTVTVTVTDGTSPIQGAKVRATLGATSNLLVTDASGRAVFLLDNGTWAIAATAPGYQGASVSQAVAGNASVTVALTAVVVTPPADPAQSTAYTLAYAPGVTLTFQLSVPPSGDGHLFSAAAVTGTANGAGLLEAALYRGATYGAYQGAKYLGSLAVPDADTFALPNWEGA